MKLGTRNSRRAGVVLLLLSGVVGILLILAMALMQMTRAWARAAKGRTSAAEARLVAEGGMDYAAARLIQDSLPGRRDVPGRVDDWTDRQGSGTRDQGSENPSYSHGESWVDDGDGLHEPGEAFGDRDGDGRFSAWTGRLRGGKEPYAIRFSLAIGSPEGGIPLNAGFLVDGNADGIDSNGDGTIDEPGERDRNGNGTSDWKDLAFPYHAGLAHVLDNLGTILRPIADGTPTGGWTRRWDIPSGLDQDGDGNGDGEPVRTSWLGNDLLANRPPGGYRSWKEVEETLLGLDPAAFPGGPYRRAELDAIRPFIDLGSYGLPSSPNAVRPVGLHCAPREVLESLWRYVGASAPVYVEQPPWPAPQRLAVNDDFPGETEAFPKVCPRSLLKYGDPDSFFLGRSVRSVRLLLFPSEAERLADAAIAYRSGPATGWRAFRKLLADRSSSLFQEDHDALGAGVPTPWFQGSWVLAKANLAFTAVCEDPIPFGGFHPSSTWASWGIDRDADPANGVQPPPMVDSAGLFVHVHPWYGFDVSYRPIWGFGQSSTAAPYADQYRISGATFRPVGLTLAPPLRFTVGSRTGGARLEGRFLAGERLDFSSRDDLENRSGGRHLWGAGIVPLDIPSLAIRRDAPAGFSPRIVTLPAWGRGVPECGAVGLGTTEDGPGSSQLYWPFTEGFDGPHEDPASIPAWRELWSAPSSFAPPLYPPPPYRPTTFAEAPYGIGIEAGPFKNGLGTVGGIAVPGQWQDLLKRAEPIDQLAAEGRLGVGSVMQFGVQRANQGYRISTRRAWRPPGLLGTEFKVECRWGLFPGGGEVEIQRIGFIPDSDVNGAWSYPVLLTLRKVPFGIGWQTEFKLYVSGAERLSFRFPEQLPAGGRRNPDRGAMIKNRWGGTMQLAGADEVRLYDAAAAPSAAGPRYVAEGTFLSPLYALDAPARLRQAQWTGASPEGGAIAVEAVGYRDTEGNEPLPPVSCGPDSAVADLRGGLSQRIRSFRYAVRLTRSAGIDETPVFESIWLTMQRKGASPAWSAWSER